MFFVLTRNDLNPNCLDHVLIVCSSVRSLKYRMDFEFDVENDDDAANFLDDNDGGIDGRGDCNADWHAGRDDDVSALPEAWTEMASTVRMRLEWSGIRADSVNSSDFTSESRPSPTLFCLSLPAAIIGRRCLLFLTESFDGIERLGRMDDCNDRCGVWSCLRNSSDVDDEAGVAATGSPKKPMEQSISSEINGIKCAKQFFTYHDHGISWRHGRGDESIRSICVVFWQAWP